MMRSWNENCHDCGNQFACSHGLVWLNWNRCYLCVLFFFFFLSCELCPTNITITAGLWSDPVDQRRVLVLCSRSLNARGGRGQCCGVNPMKKHYDSLVTVLTNINIIYRLSSQFIHICRICCGRYLSSPPKIGCMSLFKYCKGFLLKK